MANQDHAGFHPPDAQGYSYGGVENTEKVVDNYSIQNGPYKKDMSAASLRRAGARVWESPVLLARGLARPRLCWDPFNQYYDPKFTRESDPKRWQTFIDHEREQLRELMSDYGKVDYLDFDIGWPKAAAEDIAEITMMIRKMQPDVIIRDRGIGAYGDYHTPEREIPGGRQKGV